MQDLLTTARRHADAGAEFGAGAVRHLPALVHRLGGSSVLVVTDAGLASSGLVGRVRDLLAGDGIEVEVFDRVAANPSTAVVDDGAVRARHLDRPVVIGLGGGSCLDTAKAVALLGTNPGGACAYADGTDPELPGLPLVAVPTTAGTGAETNGFGVFEDTRTRCKAYVGDDSVRPRAAILDPELTLGLPPAGTAATGVDALVHGIESLASLGATPASVEHANIAVHLVAAHLEAAVEDGSDLEARAGMLLGSHLAGRALSASGLGLVHGIAHTVTSRTGAAHGLALAAVLEHVMERSAEAAAGAYRRVGDAMGTATDDVGGVVRAVGALVSDVGAGLPLRDLGVTEEMLPGIAADALRDPVSRNHPRTMHPPEVEGLLRLAW